jgi:hypothetical protein
MTPALTFQAQTRAPRAEVKPRTPQALEQVGSELPLLQCITEQDAIGLRWSVSIERRHLVKPLTLIACLTAFLVWEPAVAQTNKPSRDSVSVPNGRTPPEDKGQLQPQGWTGPITTQSGGAPAESPQGQSPPGMQAAPEGSTKTVVAPAK